METVRSVEMGSTRYDEIGEGGWLHGIGGCRQLDARVVVSLREHQLVRIPITINTNINMCRSYLVLCPSDIHRPALPALALHAAAPVGCAGFACHSCLLFTFELELLIIYIYWRPGVLPYSTLTTTTRSSALPLEECSAGERYTPTALLSLASVVTNYL